MVFQWPWGAKPCNLYPFMAQPLWGAMLVLIQVSSFAGRQLRRKCREGMNTNRCGSRRCMKLFHRWRLRATSTRACSIPDSVFFEAQSLTAQKQPYRVVRYADTTMGQHILQAMQCQMRRSGKGIDDERPVRLKNDLAVSAHLVRGNAARRAITLMPFDDGRLRYSKTRGNNARRLAVGHRQNSTFPQIIGIGFYHMRWPPVSSTHFESQNNTIGNPYDSINQ